VAADEAVGTDAAAGVGIIAAGDGAAGIGACRLHLEHGGEDSPEVAHVVVEVVGVAALLGSC
jgi:hypothetical protein